MAVQNACSALGSQIALIRKEQIPRLTAGLSEFPCYSRRLVSDIKYLLAIWSWDASTPARVSTGGLSAERHECQ